MARVVMITGAASGIGAACVRAFKAEGCDVWAADLRPNAGDDRALALDVTDPAQWDAAGRRVREASGVLDVLVNAAGISRTEAPSGILDADLAGWRRVFAVNVEGTVLGCQAAVALMGARGGAIVNIASTTAVCPTHTLGAYGASKAAVAQLTRSVAAACAVRGWPIRCNAVLPGMTDTPLLAGMAASVREAWEAQILAGRFADADEVASAIAFLAGQGASYVNGALLPVDGGLSSRPVVR